MTVEITRRVALGGLGAAATSYATGAAGQVGKLPANPLALNIIDWLASDEDLISIRPLKALRGNAFAGFFDAELRAEHLETGYLRGLEVLGGLGWSHRHDRPAVPPGDAGDVSGGGPLPPAAHDRAE